MTFGSYKATASRGHLLPGLHAAARTGRGAHSAESAPAGGDHTRGPFRDDPDTPRESPLAGRLNPADRLGGPIRLPLNGFTYY